MLKQFIFTLIAAIMLRQIMFTLLWIATYIVFPLIFPWWTVAIAALIFGFTALNARSAFSQASTLLALIWGIWAQVQNVANGGLLAGKIGALFGGISSIQLALITAAVGGLIGGLFGYLGYTLKQTLLPKRLDSF